MWFDEAVVYQIYPLGLCGAPEENDGVQAHRILRLADWAQHIKKTGADTVLLNPVFESDRHGYDIRDYFKIDCRLGTAEDMKKVCEAFHAAGLRVIFDAVFNHAGRGFWAFEDVRQKKRDSRCKDWFNISFDGNTCYNDGFWYEPWEGHYELVKLNLRNPEVTGYLLEAAGMWVREFGIDGLRLDVAYCLDSNFLSAVRSFANSVKPNFVLIGETLHGDYNRWMNENACHSVTNYECYKGLWSSFNSMNLFEIGHSLARQFGPESWTLYKNKHLLCFLDNHDVERIKTKLNDKKHLEPAYGLLFGMPGVPAVYYGSEWGAEGRKSDGDAALRPAFEKPESNSLTEFTARLAYAHRQSRALCYGSYRNILLTNRQIIFERLTEEERVLVAVNADSAPFTARFNADAAGAVDLITGERHSFHGETVLPPYGVFYWKTE